MFEYVNNVLDLKSLEFLQFMLLHNAWGIFQSWIVKNVAREMKLKRDNSRYPCNWLRATRYKLSRSTGYRDQNQPVIKPSALSGDLNQRPLLPLYFDSFHLFFQFIVFLSTSVDWSLVMILKNKKKSRCYVQSAPRKPVLILVRHPKKR